MSLSLIIGISLIGIFFGLIFLKTPIGIALSSSTIITLLIFGKDPGMFANIVYTGLAKYALLAIPFFMLAGEVMVRAGISKRIVDFATLIVGPIPGGMAIMALIVGVFWGAISGSGVASVAALGVILIPAMIEAGYPKGFAAAVLAASGALSLVIPPSVPFIIFATLANVSVGGLFIAGVVPGLFIAGIFSIYIFIYSKKHNLRGIGRFGTRKEVWKAFKDAFWGLMTPLVIFGGIYGGIFTPTEAAIVAVWYAIFVGLFAYKSFSVRTLPRIFCDAGISSASILLIMSNASMLAWAMTSQGVTASFSKLILSVSDQPFVILSMILIIVIILGFFLDGNSLEYICVPLFLPIIKVMGRSNMWFGVLIAVGIMIGVMTPPVAANLYPASRIAGISLITISKSIIWFVILAVIGCFFILFFPEISLWLPRLLGFNVR